MENENKEKTVTIKRVEALFDELFNDPDIPETVKSKLHYHLATIRLCENIDSQNRLEPAQDGNRKKGDDSRSKAKKAYEELKVRRPGISKRSAATIIGPKIGLAAGTVKNLLDNV